VTADRRLGLALSNEVPVAETVALARRAEQLGLSEVWLPESGHGRGLFTVAASVAAATQRVKIGIGIVNPFWRHPSLIAMEAAALDEASGGRVLLGLGAALWTLRALGEADARTERPLTAMVEAIQIVRGLLRGQISQTSPRVFAARNDAHLDFPRFRPSIPVYVGAVNSRMLRQAGVLADGVQLGAIVSPGYARWAWQQIREGATHAGRNPDQIDLASNVLLSVDADARAAREAVHNVLAYYIHRVEPVVLSTSGADPEELRRVRQTVIDQGVSAGARLISDGLIDTFAAAGDPDQVSERLHAYVDAGLRGVLAWHVLGPERARSLQLLAEVVRPRVFD
jgi:5,10-methylenetetrahydromethanopterin reductase